MRTRRRKIPTRSTIVTERKIPDLRRLFNKREKGCIQRRTSLILNIKSAQSGRVEENSEELLLQSNICEDTIPDTAKGFGSEKYDSDSKVQGEKIEEHGSYDLRGKLQKNSTECSTEMCKNNANKFDKTRLPITSSTNASPQNIESLNFLKYRIWADDNTNNAIEKSTNYLRKRDKDHKEREIINYADFDSSIIEKQQELELQNDDLLKNSRINDFTKSACKTEKRETEECYIKKEIGDSLLSRNQINSYSGFYRHNLSTFDKKTPHVRHKYPLRYDKEKVGNPYVNESRDTQRHRSPSPSRHCTMYKTKERISHTRFEERRTCSRRRKSPGTINRIKQNIVSRDYRKPSARTDDHRRHKYREKLPQHHRTILQTDNERLAIAYQTEHNGASSSRKYNSSFNARKKLTDIQVSHKRRIDNETKTGKDVYFSYKASPQSVSKASSNIQWHSSPRVNIESRPNFIKSIHPHHEEELYRRKIPKQCHKHSGMNRKTSAVSRGTLVESTQWSQFDIRRESDPGNFERQPFTHRDRSLYEDQGSPRWIRPNHEPPLFREPIQASNTSAKTRESQRRQTFGRRSAEKSRLYIEDEFDSLLQQSPDEIATYIGTSSDDLSHYLWKKKNHSDIHKLIILLEKLCRSDQMENNRKTLYVLKEKRFFNREDVLFPITKATISKRIDKEAYAYLLSLVTVATSLVDIVRAESEDIGLFISTTEGITKYLDESEKKNIENLVENIRESLKNQNCPTDGQTPDEGNYIEGESILPSIEEIRTNKSFTLDKRKIAEAFNSPQEYLKYTFLLYREDFLRPMRKGMQKYIEHIENPETREQRFRHDDIRVFENVNIVSSRCSKEDGIIWTIGFDVARYKYVNWNARSLLQYGTLVCLSSDDFQTIFYATVANRVSEELKQGRVDITFINSSIDEILARSLDEYIMIECKASYISYSSTLASIQDISKMVQIGENFPFSRYLVSLEKEVNHPSYFDEEDYINTLVDLSCIARSDDYPVRKVDILNIFEQPDAEMLDLDHSQQKALFCGLTKELALIQGPPGTGKTVIGLKLTNVLLNNEYLWRGNLFNRSPLLVLSYTNHALDQFLEEILKMPVMQNCMEHDLVRVGSHTDSLSLVKHNLSKRRRESQNVATNRARKKLIEREESHKTLHEDLAQIKSGILHECFLKSIGVLSTLQYDSLYRKRHMLSRYLPENGTLFCEWLNLFSNDFIAFFETVTHSNSSENELMQTDVLDNDDLFEDEDETLLFERDSDSDTEDTPSSLNENIDTGLLTSTVVGVLPYFALSKEILFPKSPEHNDRDGLFSYNSEELSYWESFDEGYRAKLFKSVINAIGNGNIMSKEEAVKIDDVWRLCPYDRWRLYRYWVNQYEANLKEKKKMNERSYERAQKRYKEARVTSDVQILKRARVVGMTTTRAAKDIELLRKIGSRIIILEEAAEVPEHHAIACITSSCKHLIMIGDHQQLRPAYNDYSLSREYNTNISLFERLVKADLPFSRLNFQHRMRPEISQLLTPHIYRRLQDHCTVYDRRNVRGVCSNVFFITHTEHENKNQEAESRSHMNRHEVDFLCELYRYLRIQGYRSNDITILTTYKDQMRVLRKDIGQMEEKEELLQSKDNIEENYSYQEINDEMVNGVGNYHCHSGKNHGHRNGVRIAAVDNFQGEENKIILLSLVRSNTEEKIGYLREANRICVALSRARDGLYIVGNFEMLEKQSRLWKKIIVDARERGRVGRSLHLKCENHPNIISKVSSAADFKNVKDGGCTQKCRYQRPCGHVCERFCHPDDETHSRLCTKECRKVLCSKSHRCKKMCYENCGPCRETVVRSLPKCGHEREMLCSDDPSKKQCKERCEVILECDHRCQKYCGETCMSPDTCNEFVKINAKCGHEVQVACCTKHHPFCKVPCNEILQCGHPCRGKCSSCFEKRLHEPCKLDCNRPQVCGHLCKDKCSIPCPSCRETCSIRCEHRDCSQICGRPCIPCREKCAWSCVHGCPNGYSCDAPCHEVCTRPRCNEPCTRQYRPCGHTCQGLLCEVCPDKCIECNRETVQEIFFGTEDEPNARFIQLKDCKCIFEVKGLDYFVDSKDQEGSKTIGTKRCPRCSTIITKSNRYNNILKQQRRDVETIYKQMEKHDPERTEIAKVSLRAKLEEIEPLVSKVLKTERYLKGIEFISLKNVNRLKTQREVDLMRNVLNFLKNINDVSEQIERLGDVGSAVTKISRSIHHKIVSLFKWTIQRRIQFSEQELEEFRLEMTRTSLHMDCVILLTDVSKWYGTGEKDQEMEEVKAFANETITKLGDVHKILMEKLTAMQDEFESHRKKIPISGIGISNREKIMVIKAMNLPVSGHWYKCKNGHYYAIGECGGAWVETKCPYCDVTIGGTNHLLHEGNVRATEMEVNVD